MARHSSAGRSWASSPKTPHPRSSPQAHALHCLGSNQHLVCVPVVGVSPVGAMHPCALIAVLPLPHPPAGPQVINVTPRYAKLHDSAGAVFGWENMELISGGVQHSSSQPAGGQADRQLGHSAAAQWECRQL